MISFSLICSWEAAQPAASEVQRQHAEATQQLTLIINGRGSATVMTSLHSEEGIVPLTPDSDLAPGHNFVFRSFGPQSTPFHSRLSSTFLLPFCLLLYIIEVSVPSLQVEISDPWCKSEGPHHGWIVFFTALQTTHGGKEVFLDGWMEREESQL